MKDVKIEINECIESILDDMVEEADSEVCDTLAEEDLSVDDIMPEYNLIIYYIAARKIQVASDILEQLLEEFAPEFYRELKAMVMIIDDLWMNFFYAFALYVWETYVLYDLDIEGEILYEQN